MKYLISELMADDVCLLLESARKRRNEPPTPADVNMGMEPCEQEGPSREELARKLASAEEKARRLKEENALLSSELATLRRNRTHVTEDMLHNKRSYEEFLTVEKLEWPSKIFKSAFVTTGSPLESRAGVDLLVIYEDGRHQKRSEGLRNSFERRFPILKETDEGSGPIIVCTKATARDGSEHSSENWILRTEAGDDYSVWFNSLSTAKTILQEAGRNNPVAVYPPGSDPKGAKTRKMLEFIFRDSGIKSILYIKPSQDEKEGPGKDRVQRASTGRSEALVVSQAGRTYSDLLKVIKEKIKPDSIAARAVKTIRESRAGNKMVIVLDKEGGTAVEQLKGELGKLESVKITGNARRNEELVIIHDIDELSSKKDIADAVCDATGLKEEQVTIGDLRKGVGGNRSTTLRLPREKAAEIYKSGKLRIGLNWCQVKEHVQVTRCFRCWGYGHLARECKESRDESKLCRKCGGSGHMAANCTLRD